MTIKVEREALFCVLSRQPSHPPCQLQSQGRGEPISDEYDDECEVESCSNNDVIFVQQQPNDGFIRLLRIPTVEKCESFDDDCTVTTASSSSTFSLDERRVTFADPLVTEVHSRPRTPREDIARLFYSCDETQRFRQEYRLERKLFAELEVDPETHPVDEEDLARLFASNNQQAPGRHRISRVVVLHNDKLETFLNPDGDISLKHTKVRSSDDFFDSDSFWSGSITWY